MGKKKRQPTEEEVRKILRTQAQRLINLPNVTSVGVGYKETDGKPTKEVCVQFTVGKKVALESLEDEGLEPLPESIVSEDGVEIAVDIIERSYKPGYEIVSDPKAERLALEETPRARRRSRLDPIFPGCSVSHIDGSAGTLGAIVYGKEGGEPYMLSNWHVLQGGGGSIGDQIVQPGPYDNGDVHQNGVGKLVRSHLGLAGDCAVASIEGRGYEESIFELGVRPARTARVGLGDTVVKSGRTTGVTHGTVSRVDVIVNLNYGAGVGVKQIGAFEIRPNPAKPPANGEVSMGGDSGSLWLVDGVEEEGDIAVGLHFAGETDPDPDAEHALACNIHSVLDKLEVSFEEPESTHMTDEDLWNAILAYLRFLSFRSQGVEKAGCTCESGGGSMVAAGAPATMTATQEGLPVYGRWCGPLHGGGTPIDDLDRACQKHDGCYGRRGYFDCQCDEALIRDIDRALSAGRVKPMGRIMGPVIKTWFRLQPCVNHGGEAGSGFGGPANDLPTVVPLWRDGQRVWKTLRDWF